MKTGHLVFTFAKYKSKFFVPCVDWGCCCNTLYASFAIFNDCLLILLSSPWVGDEGGVEGCCSGKPIGS